MNSHEKKAEVYEGVLLEELLHRAGVPHGEQLRGPLMAAHVIAEAEDGYRVAFSLAELDSGILDSGVLVADTMDGAPIYWLLRYLRRWSDSQRFFCFRAVFLL
jgi:hypothetical protein